VAPVIALLRRARVKAEPLPGLTNSVLVTKCGAFLNKIYVPFLMLPPLMNAIESFLERD